jgi:hypothetical protein
MKLKSIIYLICFAYSFSCFAESYVHPAKYDDQNEILVQGASILVSEKVNAVMMYPTDETLGTNGNFYFALTNNTQQPINFYFYNLEVYDQCGRPIKVITQREQIDRKKSSANWNLFTSALCAGVETINAQDAGKIDYQTTTYENRNTNILAHSNKGFIHSSSNTAGTTVTTGTIQSEALRQQALRQIDMDAQIRNNQITAKYKNDEACLKDFYFDSTTVFPGMIFGANFQIEVPKKIEKELEYLFFHFDVGGEKHTFCYYCGDKKKFSFFR